MNYKSYNLRNYETILQIEKFHSEIKKYRGANQNTITCG